MLARCIWLRQALELGSLRRPKGRLGASVEAVCSKSETPVIGE